MATLKSNQFHLIEDLDIAVFTYRMIERTENSVRALATTLKTWTARSQDRRQLSMMGDRMLQDIGLNRMDVEREAAKFFWQQ